MELPVRLGLVWVNRVVSVEVSNRTTLSREARFFPEASILYVDSRVSIVVEHGSQVAIVSVTNEEVVNKRGDAMEPSVAFR